MIEYLPWSTKVFDDCLEDYHSGNFSILDIELGGQCNYQCIYCDSPNREKRCLISLDKIEFAFESCNIKWVFVCGLGEPTYGKNLKLLIHILSFCEKYDAKCSIFTNLSCLNPKLEHYLKAGILNLLFKYDSGEPSKVMNLYGVCAANRQIYNIERIKNFVIVSEGCTNIAASIVPTKINKGDIINIVKDCIANNIFPLIAELENSGDAQNYYEQLSLSPQELQEIKNDVNELIGQEYVVPVCPAVICGLHIRHDANVTVDEYTGLSCHWFWLEEPKTRVVGDFNKIDIKELIVSVLQYRTTKLSEIKSLLNNRQKLVFGGCGGDVSSLMTLYLNECLRRE